jgi:L-fucose isomerase-like protein
MDSFKMIDEISLVEYSDEETADSEQLESFRKFCEEQNSEGVQESTPSASNTESAYRKISPAGGRIT